MFPILCQVYGLAVSLRYLLVGATMATFKSRIAFYKLRTWPAYEDDCMGGESGASR
jgi:hypothetical protein